MKQTISDRGMPVEERVDIRPAKGPWPGGGIGGGEHRAGARSVREGQVVVVAVLGGVTPAEISALRWLEKSGGVGGRIVVLTTKVQSGRALIKTVVPSAVEDSDRVRERILSQWGAEEG